MCITVQHLNKEFEYYKKQEGIRGSIHNLFKKEMLVKHAVKDISFSISKGEIIGFIGPNGAGKSTTLKMLTGILVPTSGSINVVGYTPYDRKNDYKRLFTIVMGQKSQLWEDLPPIETFRLNAQIYNVSDSDFNARLSMMSELLYVSHLLHIQVRRLSLGERMKMELIAAMIHNPKIIFLDEPTIGLDTVSQRNIRNFLKQYCKEFEATILLTSHSMADITDLCNRSLVINSGELIYDGKTNEIQNLFQINKRISLKLSDNMQIEPNKLFTCIESNFGYAILETKATNTKLCIQHILKKYPVLDFNISDPPLEVCIEMLYKQIGTTK